MFIVPDEKIVLLKPPYAFAEFEDGHIGGTMLVEYTVLPGPQIQWKRCGLRTNSRAAPWSALR